MATSDQSRPGVDVPTAHHLPLAGVRVLDLTRILAGPFCTMLLGDAGADVIKVEPPGGDDTRQWGPPWAEGPSARESAYYLGVNRNKRSICLDLSKPEGRAALRRLAASCDALIENFKTGTMERFGLGYEAVLRADNPRLCYASITGYGQTGPAAHLPGYDVVIEAQGGLMSITGEPEGEPVKVGVAIVDVVTGATTAFAVAAALRDAAVTGRGRRVDLSLFETQFAALANQASSFLISGQPPRRYGNAHPSIVPYQVFQAKDRGLMVGVGNDRQYQSFCAAIGRPDLAADPRYQANPDRVKHRDELVAEIAATLATRDADTWVAALGAAGVPVGPVNDLRQAFAQPHVEAIGLVEHVEHPAVGRVPVVGSPLVIDRRRAPVRRPPPRLGEHTVEVLAEAGFSAGDIDGLLRTGAARAVVAL